MQKLNSASLFSISFFNYNVVSMEVDPRVQKFCYMNLSNLGLFREIAEFLISLSPRPVMGPAYSRALAKFAKVVKESFSRLAIGRMETADDAIVHRILLEYYVR